MLFLDASAVALREGEVLVSESDRLDRGMQMRRAVLGDRHVDAAEARKTAFDEPFQRYITGAAWADIWAGQDITPRERSMITIALLAALGHDEELAMHVRASRNTGASASDIREVLMHVALYAGVPAANSAFKVARAALEQQQPATGEDSA